MWLCISLKPSVPTTMRFWGPVFQCKRSCCMQSIWSFLAHTAFQKSQLNLQKAEQMVDIFRENMKCQSENLEKYYYRNTRPEFREPSCAKSKKSWPWSCPEGSGGIINRAPKQKQKLHVWFRLGYVLQKHVAGDFQSLLLPMSSLETFSTLWNK